jgi:hypothetical protein
MSKLKIYDSLTQLTDQNVTEDNIIPESSSPFKIHPDHAHSPSSLPLFENQETPDGNKWVYRWQQAVLRVKAKIALKKLKNIAVLYGTELYGNDSTMLKESEILQDRSRKKHEIKQMKKLEKEKLPWYIIHPKSNLVKWFTPVLSISIVYTVTFVAYFVAFSERDKFDARAGIDIILDIVFFIDFFISFAMSYKRPDGSYEANLHQILYQYANGWMIIDMISAVPYGIIDVIEGAEIEDVDRSYSFLEIGEIPKIYMIFRLVRFLKIVKSNLIGRFSRVLEKYLTTPQAKGIIFALIVCICVNVTACFFYFAARVQGLGERSWVGKYGIHEEPIDTRYISSIYWSVTTLATIGYGDITPANDFERILCIIWMILGVGFYSFAIGSLSSMISSIDAQQAVLTQKLYTVSEFADEAQLDKETKDELREAIIFSSNLNGMSWSEKIELFNELPRNLKFKIASKIYSGAVNKLVFFRKKDPTFVVQIVPHLTPHLMQDNQVIYEEGNYADEMYFILVGRVVLAFSLKNYVYKSYLKNSYFGEIEIIEKIARIDKALTFGECEMLALSRTVLLQVLDDFPKESKYLKTIALERKAGHIEARNKITNLVRSELEMHGSKIKNKERNKSMLPISKTTSKND